MRSGSSNTNSTVPAINGAACGLTKYIAPISAPATNNGPRVRPRAPLNKAQAAKQNIEKLMAFTTRLEHGLFVDETRAEIEAWGVFRPKDVDGFRGVLIEIAAKAVAKARKRRAEKKVLEDPFVKFQL